MAEDPAVTRFREYIRINTMHPDPDYSICTKWLTARGEAVGGKVSVFECVPGNPIVIISFEGTCPALPSILLNSHTDVVPVFPEKWTYDPFSADKDEDGNIYGRGTQDMKCVGMQYLEAIDRLRKKGKSFKRTMHLSFVPDEEKGGQKGMMLFVQTPEFKALNVGFALDEGYANPTEKFYLFYGERCVKSVTVKCPGQPGHGSQLIKETAGEKLHRVINSFMGYRQTQVEKLQNDEKLLLGDVTTVNLTKLEGGVQYNVVPAELSVTFDIRVTAKQDMKEFEDMMKKWCEEAGEGITYTFVHDDKPVGVTCAEDGQSPWWDAFSSACKKENVELVKTIFPAATDSRYLRGMGIPALGFSPMNNTPILLHDNDEFLNEKIFLRGIDIYCSILSDIANLS